jgi:hypothetical protein
LLPSEQEILTKLGDFSDNISEVFLSVSQFLDQIFFLSAPPVVFCPDSLLFSLNKTHSYLFGRLSQFLETQHPQLFLEGLEAAVGFFPQSLLKRLHAEDSQHMVPSIVLIDGVLAQRVEQSNELQSG